MSIKYPLRLTSVVLVALLAACSGGGEAEAPDGSSGPVASDEPTTDDGCAGGAEAEITFWHTYSTDSAEDKQLTDVVLPEFAQQCPNITVDAVVMPYDGLHDQLIAAVSGGGLPDVLRMDIIWNPEFADLGVLAAVDDMPGYADLAAEVLPGPLSTTAYQGSHYGIPLDTNTQVLVYNTDIIAEPPTTLEDLRATAEDLKSQGVYGLALGGAGPWNVLPWFWTAGGTMTDDGYTTATGYLDSAESVSALQWLVDMQNDGLLGPSSIGGDPDSWGGFSSGAYATISDGPWFFSAMEADLGDHLGGVTIPEGSAGSISVVGGENLVIFETSEKQEAAWAFAQFMLSDFAQAAMAEVGQIPVTQAGLESDAVTGVDYLAPFIEQLQTAQARLPVPNWPQIDTILTDAFTAALRGTKTAEQALSDAASQVDPLLP